MSASPRSVPDWAAALILRAHWEDGAPPFSDQSLVDFRMGDRELVAIGEDAVAIAGATDAEFVVDPDARSRGLGTRMLDTLLARGATQFWAHGDAPAARALAASHRLEAVRQLLHLSGLVPTTEYPIPEHFRVGVDEDEWVALNAKTFAHHPEQGSVTRADLEQLQTEPWFSASNFLVLREDGRMIGYCWLKVENDWGEFYVVGVDPDHHGQGLGSLLFDAGLARLAQLGVPDAHLYVEADNVDALRLYHSRGFAEDAVDIQYSLRFQEPVPPTQE
jgi:mycothiol synthase